MLKTQKPSNDNNKKTHPIRKRGKDVDRHFTEENLPTTNKHVRTCPLAMGGHANENRTDMSPRPWQNG